MNTHIAAGRNWSGKVAIAGLYEHRERLTPGVHPFALQARCIRGALADAGLTLRDVDGLATAATESSEGGGTFSVVEIAEYLGLRLRYVDSTDLGGAGALAQVAHAATAIHAGRADVVVVSYAACTRSQNVAIGMGESNTSAAGPGQFEVPYGFTIVGSYALAAQRHMHEFATQPEHLAAIAVTVRAHAAKNPDARYRVPITVEDVLASPMVASPLHRLDCCVVTDGGGAVVLVGEAAAHALRKPPVWLLGAGETVSQMHMNQVRSLTSTGAVRTGPAAFDQAGLRPDDVDVAQIYDSFTIATLLGIEDLGFCEKGDGGAFVAAGEIGMGGRLPINTDGGGLSSNHPGRRGIFNVIEAARQVRGEGPGEQVQDVKVALAHGSGGTFSTAATILLGA